MKKIIGFIVVSFALLSTACGKEVKNHFKEYTFYGTATQTQISDIQAGLNQNAIQLSSIKTTNESYSKSGSSEGSQKSESTLKIYNDPQNPSLLMTELTSSVDYNASGNGITMSEKTKTNTKVWDSGNGYIFTFSEITRNNNKDESISCSEIDPSNSEEYKNNRIKNYVSLPSANTIYLNKDGSFTVISSSIEKSVSAVQWGNGTKEYITSRKIQEVYSISKDYRLTSYYYYSESKANRDPTTGEWFKKETILSNSYQRKDYKYGSRDSKSISSFTNLLNGKQIMLNARVLAYSATATLSGDTYSFTGGANLSNTYNASRISATDGIYQYEFNATIEGNYYSSEYYALRLELSYDYLDGSNGVKTGTTRFGLSDNFKNSASNYCDVVQQGGSVFLINKYYYSESFSVKFTFSSAGANITNVYY